MWFVRLWHKWLKRYRSYVPASHDHLSLNALLLLFFLTFVATTGIGAYLDNYLFYQPAMKLRMKMNRQPQLVDAIRLIVVDDRSLEKMGRTPSLKEWLQIGTLLRSAGYEMGLFQGFIDLERDVGDVASLDPEQVLPLYAGAVRNVDPNNIRALKAIELPTPLSLPCDVPQLVPKELQFDTLQTMTPKAFPFLAGIGDIALVSNHMLPRGMWLPAGGVGPKLPADQSRFIPPLGAWVLHPGKDSCLGRGLVSADGAIYTDFVKADEALHAALPVTAFFDKSYQNIVSQPSEKLSAKLAGGKVAIFIPEAFTGSRFIDSPHGKLPSYLTTVSLANSLLAKRPLLMPISPLLILFVGLCLCFGLSYWLNFKRFAIAAIAAIVGIYLSALVAVIVLDRLFPPATLLLGMALLCVVRSANHFLATVTAKTRLEKDLELGRTVQNLFIPAHLTGAIENWQYTFIYQPYGAMSGDWLQVFQPEPQTETPAMIAIGDVVGKGASAALITAVIASLWTKLRQQTAAVPVDAITGHVQNFLASMHYAIAETFKGQQNSTISLAAFHREHVVLTACGAPHWVLWQKSGTVTSVTLPPQNPLGRSVKQATIEYKSKALTMTPGDVLIAYSDGVLDGSQARSKFIKALQGQAIPQGAALLQDFVVQTARKAGEGQTLPDDFTLLVLQYFPCQVPAISSTMETTHPDLVKAE